MIKNFVSKIKDGYKNNESSILTGVIIFGTISTAVMAYKAGLKADEIIKEKKKDLNDTKKEDKDARKQVIKEAIKELTPIILPPVISGGLTIWSVMKFRKETNKKIALFSTAYNISEKSLKDLNEKMKEQLGEQKARKIKDAVVKDNLKKDGKIEEKDICVTGDGNVLCKDFYSKRLFRSNADKIERVINELSAKVLNEMYVTLNEFYSLFPKLESVPFGDDFGWTTDDLDHGRIPIYISAQLTDDREPCLFIDYTPRILHY